MIECDKAFRGYFLTLILNAVHAANESPNLRSRVYEARQRSKHDELKKLVHAFADSAVPNAAGDVDSGIYSAESGSQWRSDSFASYGTASISDASVNSAGRVSPTSSKKRGFSKRLLGVFSNRSTASSATTDVTNAIVPQPLLVDSATLADHNKEQNKRSKSTVRRFTRSRHTRCTWLPSIQKSNQAPVLAERPPHALLNHTTSAQHRIPSSEQ